MDRYYTITELVEATNLSRATIYKAINDGELPVLRPNGCKRCWRVAEQDMVRWLKEKTVRGA
jgi:excisionase family DNA binding protein